MTNFSRERGNIKLRKNLLGSITEEIYVFSSQRLLNACACGTVATCAKNGFSLVRQNNVWPAISCAGTVCTIIIITRTKHGARTKQCTQKLFGRCRVRAQLIPRSPHSEQCGTSNDNDNNNDDRNPLAQ